MAATALLVPGLRHAAAATWAAGRLLLQAPTLVVTLLMLKFLYISTVGHDCCRSCRAAKATLAAHRIKHRWCCCCGRDVAATMRLLLLLLPVTATDPSVQQVRSGTAAAYC
jgi:hypothetical protein